MKYYLLILFIYVPLVSFTATSKGSSNNSDPRHRQFTIGAYALAGKYKSEGDIEVKASSPALNIDFGTLDTISANYDSSDTGGVFTYLGFTFNRWFSWAAGLAVAGSEGDVAFTSSKGSTLTTEVKGTMIFISPLIFSAYPLDIFYVRLAPGIGIEAGEIKTSSTSLPKLAFATAGGGILFSCGVDFKILSWLALNAGFTSMTINTSASDDYTVNPGNTLLEIKVKAKERKIRYNAMNIGVTFYL